jgi:hypothetical protein
MSAPAGFNWSPSSLSSFETCGRRHHEVKVLKNFPDPPGPAAQYGTDVHKSLEEYCRDGVPIPAAHRQYQGYADILLALPGRKFYEQKVGIRKDFSPCGFFDADVWHRCVIDMLILDGERAACIDHKTGKVKHDLTQLNLNAAVVFAHHPEVQTVSLAYAWIAQGRKFTRHKVDRRDLPDLWARLLPRVNALERAFETGRWLPNPSGLCRRYCPVTTCQFHGGA